MFGDLFKIVVLILVFSTLSYATPDGPDNFNIRGVASYDVLWMHPTPNYKSRKIGKIPYNGKCIKNLGCRGRWCRVNYKGTVGWVNGRFLMEGGSCSQASYHSQKRQKHSYQRFTREMLRGQVLQTRKYGSYLTVRFRPPSIQSFDGDIVFHFSSNPANDNEILSYRLIGGKIVYYGNDGSKHRMTLLSINNGTWTVLEEEDMDGDGSRFRFGQAVKKVYTVKKLGRV